MVSHTKKSLTKPELHIAPLGKKECRYYHSSPIHCVLLPCQQWDALWLDCPWCVCWEGWCLYLGTAHSPHYELVAELILLVWRSRLKTSYLPPIRDSGFQFWTKAVQFSLNPTLSISIVCLNLRFIASNWYFWILVIHFVDFCEYISIFLTYP